MPAVFRFGFLLRGDDYLLGALVLVAVKLKRGDLLIFSRFSEDNFDWSINIKFNLKSDHIARLAGSKTPHSCADLIFKPLRLFSLSSSLSSTIYKDLNCSSYS